MSRHAARLTLPIVFLLLTWSVYGQVERVVSIVPDRPEAGTGFVVSVTMPGEPAEDVEAIEPGVLGPARYTGSDVKPIVLADGAVASIIEYRFITSEPGRIDIVELSALSRGRTLQFGTWTIEAVAGSRPVPKRSGSWKAPITILERQRFIVSARDPDGLPIACPTFAVEGALFEPIVDSPGAFYAVALEPGSIRLPALLTSGDACVLLAHTITVKPVPAKASGARSVGSDFRLELTLADARLVLQSGEAISYDIRATGLAWPGLALAPDVQLESPDGSTSPVLDGLVYTGGHAVGSYSYSGRRGTVLLSEPGWYTLRALAYPWFDTETATLRQATAQAVRLKVLAPDKMPWIPPESLIAFTRARLVTLAESAEDWAPVLSAFERGDWPGASTLAHTLTGIREERGAILNVPVAGRSMDAVILALASLRLVAPKSDDAERAESYAVLLRQEAGAFRARNISGTLDDVSLAFGTIDRQHFAVPQPGYLRILALLCLITFLVTVAVYRWGSHRNRRFVTKGLLAILAIVLAVVLSLVLVSAIEHSRPRFVSLGAKARTVPSLLSAEGNDIPAGRSGRVLESAGPWLFVEVYNGEASWLLASDVVLY